MRSECMVDGEVMFTRVGAAERLGVSPFTMLREAKAGRIGFMRHPSRGLLFSESDLAEWKARMRTEAKNQKVTRGGPK